MRAECQMDFQTSDAMLVISQLGIAASFLAGIPVGWVVVRGIDIESVAAGMIQVGLPFFFVMALSWYAESVPVWEAWLGVVVLYAVYSVGCVLGFWLRRRSGNRLR
jgi:uncharacterized protein YneF (UPF0154 family)